MTVHRTSFNIRFNTMQLHRQLARRALRQDELALLAGYLELLELHPRVKLKKASTITAALPAWL